MLMILVLILLRISTDSCFFIHKSQVIIYKDVNVHFHIFNLSLQLCNMLVDRSNYFFMILVFINKKPNLSLFGFILTNKTYCLNVNTNLK